MTGPQQTLTLTKRGEGMARAIKLSRIAEYAARMDWEYALLLTAQRVRQFSEPQLLKNDNLH